MRTLLHKTKVRAWLRTFAPDTSCSALDCPLARYLKTRHIDVSGVYVAISGVTMYEVDRDAPGLRKIRIRQPLPEWAGPFIRRVDDIGAGEVLASEALTLLEGL
jgi:hypothetical protein